MRNIIKYMMSFILTLSLANIALAQDVEQPQPSEDTDNSEPASALASTRKSFTITIGTEPEAPLNTTEPTSSPDETPETTEPEAPLDKDASAESVVSLEEDTCSDFLYKKDEISEFDDTEICVDKDNNVWHKPVQCGTNQELYKGICVSILETVLEIEVDGGAEFGVFAEDPQFEFGTGVYVNWGDGAEDVAVFRETPTEPEYREIQDKEYLLDKLTPEIKHTYQEKGTYTVKVKSADGVSFFDRGSFADKIKGEMTYSTQETKVINVKVKDYGNIQNNAFQYVENFNKGLPETTMAMTNTDNMPLNVASGRRDYYVGHISREKTPSTNLAPSASSTGGGVSSGGGSGGGSGGSSGRRGGSSWVGRSGGSSGGGSNTTTPAITIINPSSTGDGETSPIPSTDIDVPTLIPDNGTTLESTPVTPITPIEEHYEPITDVKVTINSNEMNDNMDYIWERNYPAVEQSSKRYYCDTDKYYYTKENCDGELIGETCDDGTTVYAEKCSRYTALEFNYIPVVRGLDEDYDYTAENMTCKKKRYYNQKSKQKQVIGIAIDKDGNETILTDPDRESDIQKIEEKYGSDFKADAYYFDCYCDTSKYRYTKEICSGELQGETCNDGTTVYAERCSVETKCDKYSDARNTEFGTCAEYWEDCPTICKFPPDHNCPNREDNIGEYGCLEYWEDCASKCERPRNTCTKNKCIGYNFKEIPVDPHMTSYEKCTVGCGNNQTSYKITGCREGFTVSGDRTKCVKIEENDCSDYLYKDTDFLRDDRLHQDYLVNKKFALAEKCVDKNGTWFRPLVCYPTGLSYGSTHSTEGYEPFENLCIEDKPTILEIEVDAGAEFGVVPTSRSCGVGDADYGIIIDWGDGTIEKKVLRKEVFEEKVYYWEYGGSFTTLTGVAQQLKHTYAEAGTYQVTVRSSGVEFFDRGTKYLTFSGGSTLHRSTLPIEECSDGDLKGDRPCLDKSTRIKTKVKSVKIKEYGNASCRAFYDVQNLIGPLPSPAPVVPGLFVGFENYRTKLSGEFPDLKIDGLGSGHDMFYGCSNLTGPVPKLPEGLSDATNMFYGCTGLIGSVPELPEGLIGATDMFRGCTGLTGGLPKLPDSLTSASGMFAETGLTEIKTWDYLPKGIEDVAYMFSGCKNLKKIPEELNFSDYNIKDMRGMFSSSGIEIKVPDLSNLPENVEMHSLFDGCSGLTGDMPDLSVLKQTDLRYLFRDCLGITGEIKALPENLEIAWGMFENCYGLTGSIPQLPSNLKDAEYMFHRCSGLTGSIPQLPSTLYDGHVMFDGCYCLEGSVAELPSSLMYADNMFYLCKNLTGDAPKKPETLIEYYQIFGGTKITPTEDWPDGAFNCSGDLCDHDGWVKCPNK